METEKSRSRCTSVLWWPTGLRAILATELKLLWKKYGTRTSQGYEEIFILKSPNRTPSVTWNHRSNMPRSVHLCVIDGGGVQTLGVLDVDGLDVAVQTLLSTLLVVTLREMRTRRRKGTPLMPASQTFLLSWGSRRTSLVPCMEKLAMALGRTPSVHQTRVCRGARAYHSMLGKGTDLLDGAGSALLEANTVAL